MIHDDNGIRRITYIRTIDGDNFVGDLQLAPWVRPKPKLEISVRVAGWDAAELNEIEGPFMRTQFEELLVTASVITIKMRTMSFHRIVSDVYLDDILFEGLLRNRLAEFREKKV